MASPKIEELIEDYAQNYSDRKNGNELPEIWNKIKEQYNINHTYKQLITMAVIQNDIDFLKKIGKDHLKKNINKFSDLMNELDLESGYGTDIAGEDEEDEDRPIHFIKSLEVAKFLIENDANVNIRSKKGETILTTFLRRYNESRTNENEDNLLQIIFYLIEKSEKPNNYRMKILFKTLLNEQKDNFANYLINIMLAGPNTQNIFINIAKDSDELSIALDILRMGNILSNNMKLHINSLLDKIEQTDFNISNYLIENGARLEFINKILQQAITYSKQDLAYALIEIGADINTQDSNGNTLLHKVTDKNVATDLINRGANLEIQDRYGKTPLQRAITNGKLDIVYALIDGGADINTQDSNGNTLLHTVKDSNTLTYLINKGANLEIQNKKGITPLQQAITNKELDIVDFLIDRGADINTQDSNGNTLLHTVKDSNILTYLINKGANLEIQNKNGITPLQQAITNRKLKLDLAYALIDGGADINTQDSNGNTLLHTVRDKNAVIDLINRGANFNIQNKNGITPLQQAITNGKQDLAYALIDGGADINTQDSNGNTLLHKVRDKNTAIDLINRGANFNIQNKNGITPLQQAITNGKLDLAYALIDGGADINTQDSNGNTLLHKVRDKNAAIDLINRGANFNIQNKNGITPLQQAITNGKLDLVYALIEIGADINTQNSNGNTLLHKIRNKNVATDLINRGANLEIQNKNGKTPFQQAIVDKRREIAETLIDGGADNKGYTNLRIAVETLDIEHTKILLENGADVNEQDTYRNTPVHYAIMADSRKLYQILIDRGANIYIPNEKGITPQQLIIGKIFPSEYLDLFIESKIEDLLEMGYQNNDNLRHRAKKLVMQDISNIWNRLETNIQTEGTFENYYINLTENEYIALKKGHTSNIPVDENGLSVQDKSLFIYLWRYPYKILLKNLAEQYGDECQRSLVDEDEHQIFFVHHQDLDTVEFESEPKNVTDISKFLNPHGKAILKASWIYIHEKTLDDKNEYYTSILDNLIPNIVKCIINGQKIIIIEYVGGTRIKKDNKIKLSAHANVLIIDLIHGKIMRSDPHGTGSMFGYLDMWIPESSEKIREAINEELIENGSEENIIKKLDYINIGTTCFLGEGLQSIGAPYRCTTHISSPWETGYCQTYSIMMIQILLQNKILSSVYDTPKLINHIYNTYMIILAFLQVNEKEERISKFNNENFLSCIVRTLPRAYNSYVFDAVDILGKMDEYTDKYGSKALHVAVYKGRPLSVAKLLIENTSDVNITDNAGHTPLDLVQKAYEDMSKSKNIILNRREIREIERLLKDKGGINSDLIGGSTLYYNKYIKYKLKYLQLKKQNFY